MLERVCSGGQNGVDLSALRAAKDSGIPTGGWMPNGWITLDGPKPEYDELYGTKEHPNKGYPARTEANVKDSDGTLRFAKNFKSAGERCTKKAIDWYNKPYFDISIDAMPPQQTVIDWLKEHNIKVLNVAGNSENTAKGIGDVVYEYLMTLFRLISVK